MQKKEQLVLREKLSKTITFCAAKIEKNFFYKKWVFLLLLKKIKISATFDPPNRRWGAIFNRGAPKNGVFFSLNSFPATPLKSATLWGSCCLKTTKVVFVAKNCWFYQNLKKIGTTNEYWIVERWGSNICCWYVATEAPRQYVAKL